MPKEEEEEEEEEDRSGEERGSGKKREQAKRLLLPHLSEEVWWDLEKQTTARVKDGALTDTDTIRNWGIACMYHCMLNIGNRMYLARYPVSKFDRTLGLDSSASWAVICFCSGRTDCSALQVLFERRRRF